jgi:hypothetical protein
MRVKSVARVTFNFKFVISFSSPCGDAGVQQYSTTYVCMCLCVCVVEIISSGVFRCARGRFEEFQGGYQQYTNADVHFMYTAVGY